jgi:uncharacterized protein (UPF0332 family)
MNETTFWPKAREGLEEAEVLFGTSHYGTTAQRAYFAMFYVAWPVR